MNTSQRLSYEPAVASHQIDRRSIYVSSIMATTVFVALAAGAPSWFAFNLAWGAAIGLMGAIWIGPGFGLMLAGARIALAEDRLGPQAWVRDVHGPS